MEDGHEFHSPIMDACHFFLTSFKLLLIGGGIALLTNLYRKAMTFEKGHCAPDPEKVIFYNQVGEIQEKVEEIYKKSINADLTTDLAFKNQKLVAWLLNRSKES